MTTYAPRVSFTHSPFYPHVVSNWPHNSRHEAERMMKKYGLPDEATESMVIWNDREDWRRIVVHRDGVRHNFPSPHEDIVEQTVEYRVPHDKYEEVMMFDGSLVIDRTRGEVTARCNSEEMNIILLNLAHDIVMGKKTPKEARKVCAALVFRLKFNWPIPYAEELKLPLSPRRQRDKETMDPDKKTSVASQMLGQT